MAALLLGAVAALAGRRRIALLGVALAAVNASGLLPGLLAPGRPDPTQPQLRLLVANVWFPGDDYRSLLELVNRERPDVIGLVELTRDWAAGLDPGLEGYPHRVLRAQADGYGIGLYSRMPLRNARIVYPGGSQPPVARAGVVANGRVVELFVVHGPSATSRGAATRHRKFMRNLGRLAGEAGEAALVCGDLNAPPWTGPFRELRRRGRLERDDAWRPPEWTFPVWNWLLRTPLDQCLAGSGLSIRSWTGPASGSDHLPLLSEISLSAPDGAPS